MILYYSITDLYFLVLSPYFMLIFMHSYYFFCFIFCFINYVLIAMILFYSWEDLKSIWDASNSYI